MTDEKNPQDDQPTEEAPGQPEGTQPATIPGAENPESESVKKGNKSEHRIKFRMKLLYLVLAFACVEISGGVVIAQKKRTPLPSTSVEANENSWKTIVSSDGTFSVMMPGQPSKGGQVINTGVGPLPSIELTLKTATSEYLVTYTDFPSAFDDPALLKFAYDSGRDETIKSNKLTFVSERDFSLDRYTGRHIVAEARGELVHIRIIAVDKRLYQLLAITRDYRSKPPGIALRSEHAINKFLNSFRLIPKNIDAPPQTVELSADAPIDLGRFEGSLYVNDAFKFKLSLPDKWNVVEREERQAALKIAKEQFKGENKEANDRLERSLAKTVVLFTATRHPLRTPNVIQAMLQCGVERLNDKRISARNYLEQNRNFLVGSSGRYKLVRDVYPETIGGQSFFAMQLDQSAGNVTVNQAYYATIRNGQALFFVTSYFNEADRLELEKILKGIVFE